MRVVLRNLANGFYYAGEGWWVKSAMLACNLETIEHAAEVGRDTGLDNAVVVVSIGDPACEWVLPLARPRPTTGAASSGAVV